MPRCPLRCGGAKRPHPSAPVNGGANTVSSTEVKMPPPYARPKPCSIFRGYSTIHPDVCVCGKTKGEHPLTRPRNVKKVVDVSIAPETPLEAYRRLLDLVGAVGGLRVAAQSELHPLHKAGGLPEDCVRHIIDAHQSLMSAHRVLESHLVTGRYFGQPKVTE